jgi:hypothetical protein
MEGIRRKADYTKCSKCDVYVNFRALKSYMCPCCHLIMQRKRYAKGYNKKVYDRAYYRNNKHKWIIYNIKKEIPITV